MKYKQNLRNLQNQPVTVSQKTGLNTFLRKIMYDFIYKLTLESYNEGDN